ncbi:MAG: alanine racemase [Pseudomonadota bacterium]
MHILARIDFSAIVQNFYRAQELAGDSVVIPVIKANAYGHGAIQVAQALNGAALFAVARMSEAQQLRDAGVQQPLLILSETWHAESFQLASEQNYVPVIHDEHSISLLDQVALSSPIDVWLKIDTGMHRLGIYSDGAYDQINRLKRIDCVRSVCLMTHFATADASSCDFLDAQYQVFQDIQRDHPSLSSSMANSAALLRSQTYHADFVRPGIMLYGADPLFKLGSDAQLACTMQLTAPVLSVRRIHKGESAGYNRSWYAGRDSLIATVGIGYADGYPRHAKNGTPVAINGKIYPLVGTVSMDMICVDVTDAPLEADIKVGARAELWGKQVNVNDVALSGDTIAYELFTSLGRRVTYVDLDSVSSP